MKRLVSLVCAFLMLLLLTACESSNTISSDNGICNHSYSDATCTEASKCTKCGEVIGEALGHLNEESGKCDRCGMDFRIDMNTRVGSPNDCDNADYVYLGGFAYEMNSADGVEVLWGAENNSGKTVNYYTVKFHFYDRVGGEARSEITGQSTKSCRWVGPIAPGGDFLICDLIDYVPTCYKVQIDEIKLEYADGTVEYGTYGWSTTKRGF